MDKIRKALEALEGTGIVFRDNVGHYTVDELVELVKEIWANDELVPLTITELNTLDYGKVSAIDGVITTKWDMPVQGFWVGEKKYYISIIELRRRLAWVTQ